jgi:hypothetical protein
MLVFDNSKSEPIGPNIKALRTLAYILQHQEMWPEEFEWDYRYVSGCALGLAVKYFGDVSPYETYEEYAGRNFKLDPYDVDKLFIERTTFFFGFLSVPMNLVTPKMVARRLEKFIAEQ